MSEQETFNWFISNLKDLGIKINAQTKKKLKELWTQKQTNPIAAINEIAKNKGHHGFTVG